MAFIAGKTSTMERLVIHIPGFRVSRTPLWVFVSLHRRSFQVSEFPEKVQGLVATIGSVALTRYLTAEVQVQRTIRQTLRGAPLVHLAARLMASSTINSLSRSVPEQSA